MRLKAIFLDRDGVINYDSDDYIKSVDEWRPIPGSLEAITKLKKQGYTIIVLTNQSGIARGYYSVDALNAMHNKLHSLLASLGGSINGIFFCPHGPDDGCDCRKPRPGLFHKAAQAFGISLENVIAVGDSWRDLKAAMAVKARPILVRTGKGEQTLAQQGEQLRDLSIPVYSDLAAVVDDIGRGVV